MTFSQKEKEFMPHGAVKALSPKMPISGKELANGPYRHKEVLSTLGAMDIKQNCYCIIEKNVRIESVKTVTTETWHFSMFLESPRANNNLACFPSSSQAIVCILKRRYPIYQDG